MSITYSIEINLNDKLNRNNVKLMIERALAIQCIFFSTNEYEYFKLDQNKPLKIDAIIDIVMKLRQNTGHGGPIIIHKDQAQMLLSFEEYNDYLMLDLTLFAYDWEKEFANGEEGKDFARYIRLLLSITQDFPIINIRIKYE